MTTRLLLVRHGHHAEVGRVLSGRSEIALDAAGAAQAEALAQRLGTPGVTAIHSSPRRRALDTAAPLAVRTGVPVQIVPAVDEIGFGAFAGRAFAELQGEADWHRWNAERATFRCPGGETMAEATARAEAHLLALPRDGGTVVLVTHCDVIRGIVARLLGIPFGAMFALPCDPGSISEVAPGADGLSLVALNDRPCSSSPPSARSRAGG